jgi:predicted nucleotidyltransferase component of viral defense system
VNEKQLKNISQSVRQRLLNISRQQNVDFGVVLTNYALERFLYRLSCSDYRNRFVLKGAVLFRIWSDEPHRATRDLDLLAFGDPAAAEISRLFGDVCNLSLQDDGVQFQPESIRTEDISDAQEYGGLRIRLNALIAGARVPVKIDIGFGDAVTPPPEEMRYPTILDFPAPVIRTYPRETVVAEKLHAMVALGIANSRMKDFYDIYSLAGNYEFDGTRLCSAIRSTFERRTTVIPVTVPIALTLEFSQDDLKMSQWRAFVNGGNVRQVSLTLTEVVETLGSFLLPAMNAASQGQQFAATWVPPGPWEQ